MKMDAYYGTAATELLSDENNSILYVYAPEIFPGLTGEVGEEIEFTPAVTNLAPGGPVPEKVAGRWCLKCHYGGSSSGRTRPDIAIGERVLLMAPAGTYDFKWYSNEIDQTKRTTEHVELILAARPDKNTVLDATNSYRITADTRKGSRHVSIATSQGNGELFGYQIKLDIETGKFTFIDSVGNQLLVDSLCTLISLITGKGGMLSIDGKDISLKGDSLLADVPASTFTGTVSIAKGLSVLAGGGTLSGGMTLDGDARIEGNVSVSGGVSNDAGGYLHSH